MSHAQLVTLHKFEELTGYTVKAAQRKIQEGVFVQGQVWLKAPDGRILIDMEGYHRWARNQQACPVQASVISRQDLFG